MKKNWGFFILVSLALISQCYGRATVSIKIVLGRGGLCIEDNCKFHLTICFSNLEKPCHWSKEVSHYISLKRPVTITFPVDSVSITYFLDATLRRNLQGSAIATFTQLSFGIRDPLPQYVSSSSPRDTAFLELFASYECSEFFYGKNCEKLCLPQKDQHRICTSTGQSVCAKDYRELDSRCAIDRCKLAGNPCSNMGKCINTASGTVCVCSKGFTGSHCNIRDPCFHATCFNGGTCLPSLSPLSPNKLPYKCLCTVGYSGINCNRLSRTWTLPGDPTPTKDVLQSITLPTQRIWIEYNHRPTPGSRFVPGNYSGKHFNMVKENNRVNYYKISLTTFIVICAFCIVSVILVTVTCYVFRWKQKNRRSYSSSMLTTPTAFSGELLPTFKRCNSLGAEEDIYRYTGSSICSQSVAGGVGLCNSHHVNGCGHFSREMYEFNNLSLPPGQHLTGSQLFYDQSPNMHCPLSTQQSELCEGEAEPRSGLSSEDENMETGARTPLMLRRPHSCINSPCSQASTLTRSGANNQQPFANNGYLSQPRNFTLPRQPSPLPDRSSAKLHDFQVEKSQDLLVVRPPDVVEENSNCGLRQYENMKCDSLCS